VIPENGKRHEAKSMAYTVKQLAVMSGVGKKRFRLGTRESMLIPRNIEHAWATVSAPAKIINTYQPAGKIEDFFQALATFKDLPTREQAIEKSYTAKQIDGLKRVFKPTA